MSASIRSAIEAARAGFQGEIRFDESLSKHTYYRIGGPAAAVLLPNAHADLDWISRLLAETRAPYAVVGSGSNLLVPDEGYPGIIIKTIRLDSEIRPQPDAGLVTTGAGVAISSLLRRCAQEGWAGLEFLSGIPGSAGGAVWMNAGTHLGESGGALESVDTYSLTNAAVRTFARNELRFEYRKNLFLPTGALVTAATWRIRLGDPAQVKAQLDDVLQRRKATQPIDLPSCGSVFKNPREAGLHAWQVIDQLGLRGHRIGGAEFSAKHCNFIVNLGGARAADVRQLIDLAKSRALKELGVDLHEEVVVL